MLVNEGKVLNVVIQTFCPSVLSVLYSLRCLPNNFCNMIDYISFTDTQILLNNINYITSTYISLVNQQGHLASH